MTQLKGKDIFIGNPNVLGGLLTNTYDPQLVKIVTSLVNSYGIAIMNHQGTKQHSGSSTGSLRDITLSAEGYKGGEDTVKKSIEGINKKWKYDANDPESKCAVA